MKKNILISCHFIGDFGGQGRNVYSTYQALCEHNVDIWTQKIIDSEYMPHAKSLRLVNPAVRNKTGLSFIFKKIERRLRRASPAVDRLLGKKTYDIYIQYYRGSYVADKFNCKLKLLIPSGNDVRKMEHQFDYILSQAADGDRYLKHKEKHVVACPPVTIPVSYSEPLANLPEKFFLTVFHPYTEIRQYEDGLKPYKGYDVLYDILDSLPFPIVWCYDNRIFPELDGNIPDHPKLVQIVNASQGQIRYLYEKSTAYVGFSREEGFGWSIADALLYHKPILARRVGVLTLYGEEKGLYIYNDVDELKRLFRRGRYEKPNYDNTVLNPQNFMAKILSLSEGKSEYTPE